jgi:hypothetical protein
VLAAVKTAVWNPSRFPVRSMNPSEKPSVFVFRAVLEDARGTAEALVVNR